MIPSTSYNNTNNCAKLNKTTLNKRSSDLIIFSSTSSIETLESNLDICSGRRYLSEYTPMYNNTNKLSNYNRSSSLTNIREMSPTNLLTNSISALHLATACETEQTYDFNEDIVLVDEETTKDETINNSKDYILEPTTASSSSASLKHFVYELVSSDDEEENWDLNSVIIKKFYNNQFKKI